MLKANSSHVVPGVRRLINRRFRWWPVRVPASGEIKSEDRGGGVRYERRHKHQRATHSIMLPTPSASILAGRRLTRAGGFRWISRSSVHVATLLPLFLLISRQYLDWTKDVIDLFQEISFQFLETVREE